MVDELRGQAKVSPKEKHAHVSLSGERGGPSDSSDGGK